MWKKQRTFLFCSDYGWLDKMDTSPVEHLWKTPKPNRSSFLTALMI